MKHYKLTPLDTLFFRGGQPFNAGETGQIEVAGQFPPPPATAVGAMRAALARANGWNEKEKTWSQELKAVLGDGDHLGQLKFHGSYLLKNNDPLFPMPLHVLGKTEKTDNGEKEQMHFTRLKPGAERKTDIGKVRLPEIVNQNIKGFKALESRWLTKSGMEKVLAGAEPDENDVLKQACLWQTENRVGIQRDPNSKTTKDNALYQTAHVRLAKDVALAISMDGLSKEWEPQSPAPLGGETRQAWIEGIEPLLLPAMPELKAANGKVHYTATLITPAKLTGNGWRLPNGEIEGLAGQIVSACIGKPVLIGGWDSLKHQPKALEPYLPAGSTFFMEADESGVENIKQQHGKHIGEKSNWGYGQILIGVWQ
jgi:CRISPR-associated protein Cmr3